MMKRKWAKFQDQGFSRSKVKRKEDRENEHREKAKFLYNFVQNANAVREKEVGLSLKCPFGS